MKIVFATNNQNKIKEVQSLIPKSIELLSLKDIGCFEEIEETEKTLKGNAKLKADYISQNYGYDCFADDTGLEVEVLNGAPGIFSARYAGEDSNSVNNMNKLLAELNSATNRKAQFQTIITLNLNRKQFFFDGICKGEILKEKSGISGFGYDPIFSNDGINTLAQISSDKKNKISHRSLALKKIIRRLTNEIN